MNRDFPVPYRIPLLIAGFISLALGIGSGLARLGWDLPLPAGGMAAWHGPLMVCGFLGTVIALERAVAIGQPWAYLGPLAAALGGLALPMSADGLASAGLTTLASALLAAASWQIWRRQRALFTLTLLLGSLCWLVGNLLWLGGLAIIQATPWWISFLVLTIAGERLELSRLLPPSRGGKAAFVAIIVLFLYGVGTASLSMLANSALLAVALLALALWLLRHDIARRTVKQQGLSRFIAICLLSGYGWLLAGALSALWAQPLMPGASYDAFLHAIFVGFVFSMIFGHAPVIFPAVVRVKIPYHPVFYLPLIVLHVSLAVRIAGDLLILPPWRSAGGALNALALALFVASTVAAVIRGKRVT